MARSQWKRLRSKCRMCKARTLLCRVDSPTLLNVTSPLVYSRYSSPSWVTQLQYRSSSSVSAISSWPCSRGSLVHTGGYERNGVHRSWVQQDATYVSFSSQTLLALNISLGSRWAQGSGNLISRLTRCICSLVKRRCKVPHDFILVVLQNTKPKHKHKTAHQAQDREYG